MSDETITERPVADGDDRVDADVSAVDEIGTDDIAVDSVLHDSVSVDVAAVLAARDEYKDIALRLQADFENYR